MALDVYALQKFLEKELPACKIEIFRDTTSRSWVIESRDKLTDLKRCLALDQSIADHDEEYLQYCLKGLIKETIAERGKWANENAEKLLKGSRYIPTVFEKEYPVEFKDVPVTKKPKVKPKPVLKKENYDDIKGFGVF